MEHAASFTGHRPRVGMAFDLRSARTEMLERHLDRAVELLVRQQDVRYFLCGMASGRALEESLSGGLAVCQRSGRRDAGKAERQLPQAQRISCAQRGHPDCLLESRPAHRHRADRPHGGGKCAHCDQFIRFDAAGRAFLRKAVSMLCWWVK